MASDQRDTRDGLDRFRQAQESGGGSYTTALAEIRAGRKRSHWIWYIFPQLAGLGRSSTARHYGLRDAEEARAYLADPLLRERLATISAAAAEGLGRGIPLAELMGSEIDAVKLVSSMTLFWRVGQDHPEIPGATALADVAERVLHLAELQGYPGCAYTLGVLRR